MMSTFTVTDLLDAIAELRREEAVVRNSYNLCICPKGRTVFDCDCGEKDKLDAIRHYLGAIWTRARQIAQKLHELGATDQAEAALEGWAISLHWDEDQTEGEDTNDEKERDADTGRVIVAIRSGRAAQ